jgi:hypothetical protein
MKARLFEIIPKIEKRKLKIIYLYVPKKSNPNGFTDEGLSDVLKKLASFKYSETFLKRWYADIEKYDIQIKFVKNKRNEREVIKNGR